MILFPEPVATKASFVRVHDRRKWRLNEILPPLYAVHCASSISLTNLDPTKGEEGYFEATIARDNGDATYLVHFDDGDVLEAAPRHYIRELATPSNHPGPDLQAVSLLSRSFQDLPRALRKRGTIHSHEDVRAMISGLAPQHTREHRASLGAWCCYREIPHPTPNSRETNQHGTIMDITSVPYSRTARE